LVEETGVPRETHDLQQVTDKLTNHIMLYWVHLTMSRIQTHNFGGGRHYLHIGSYKSSYHTIMTISKDDLAPSPDTAVSSINKSDCYNVIEIFAEVSLDMC
jgi:hypothetical protein